MTTLNVPDTIPDTIATDNEDTEGEVEVYGSEPIRLQVCTRSIASLLVHLYLVNILLSHHT